MQKAAYGREELASLAQRIAGARGVNSLRRQTRQPSNEVPIPQSARSLLDIGLAMVNRVLKFSVAHARVLRQMLGQFGAVLFQKTRPFILETRMQGLVAGQVPKIQKINVQIDVL